LRRPITKRLIVPSILVPIALVLLGGSYQLNGGCWGGASIANYIVYLPLAVKNF